MDRSCLLRLAGSKFGLSGIDLTQCRGIGHAFHALSTIMENSKRVGVPLKHIILKTCSITDDQIRPLLKAVAEQKSMETLDLSGNGALTVVASPKRSLTAQT